MERARVLDVLERFRGTPRELIRDQLKLAEKTLIESDPDNRDGFIRILPDGTRQHGVLLGSQFVPV
jgi:hypothetical protein